MMCGSLYSLILESVSLPPAGGVRRSREGGEAPSAPSGHLPQRSHRSLGEETGGLA